MWATTPQLRIKIWKIPFCSFVVNHLLSPPSLGKQLRDTVYQLTIVNLIYITLTHKLQKTAQEAKPLWLQVQNHHDFSIITSLPIFALFFILGLSRESQTYSCNESRRIPTSNEPSSGSWMPKPPIRVYLNLPLPTTHMSNFSSCNAGDWSLIPGSGRSPGGENGNPFQHSSLKNSTDRGAWWAMVHVITELDTTEWLSHTHAYVLSLPNFLWPHE